jgi:hypothetical protein
MGLLGVAELGGGEVELCLKLDDAIVELAITEEVGVESPVVEGPDLHCDLVEVGGGALQGFSEGVGEGLWRVSDPIVRLSVYLPDIRLVGGSVGAGIGCDPTILELFDILGGSLWSTGLGYCKGGKVSIFFIPFGRTVIAVPIARMGEFELFLQLFDTLGFGLNGLSEFGFPPREGEVVVDGAGFDDRRQVTDKGTEGRCVQVPVVDDVLDVAGDDAVEGTLGPDAAAVFRQGCNGNGRDWRAVSANRTSDASGGRGVV